MTPTYFKSPSALRRWFETNSATVRELWVGFYKKDSGKPSVTYPEALDEALCVGWIDGVRKSLDELSYTIRFTPRKPKSHWSAVNIARVGELTARGLMKASGLATFESRDKNAPARYSSEARPEALDPLYERTFTSNARAWAFFSSQPPGYRRTAIWYVLSAKQEPTRLKRLGILMAYSDRGERLPSLTSPKAARVPAKAPRSIRSGKKSRGRREP
jgi:uncharacterized protein YdeI (YjbR/CyaY-like superfamily)